MQIIWLTDNAEIAWAYVWAQADSLVKAGVNQLASAVPLQQNLYTVVQKTDTGWCSAPRPGPPGIPGQKLEIPPAQYLIPENSRS